jgi:hypothetical protein
MMHRPDLPEDASTDVPPALPAEASEGEDAAYEALVTHYVDKAFERVAPTIPASDAPGVRAGLEVFYRTNPRARQLLEQLRTLRPVEKSGTTSRGDEASVKAPIGKQG